MPDDPDHKRRKPFIRFAALFCMTAAVLIGSALIRYPDTPLPPRWNVFEPLVVTDPVTPLTSWKLDWAISDPKLCLSVLETSAELTALDDLTVSETCGISGRLRLSAVGASSIAPLETACATALRLAMWEHHGVQPAALEILGQDVRRLRHIGSYNCRPISGTTRWSTHSTADAIDITGFDLADGSRITLINDWTGSSPKAEFLWAVRNAACTWFGTTLGPDYNAAHADHFHLQNKGWGTCR